MDTRGNLKCECCYYSEMIDGTLYCHHKEEDVLFDDCCDSFVNNNRLKDIFESIKEFLKIGGIYG